MRRDTAPLSSIYAGQEEVAVPILRTPPRASDEAQVSVKTKHDTLDVFKQLNCFCVSDDKGQLLAPKGSDDKHQSLDGLWVLMAKPYYESAEGV